MTFSRPGTVRLSTVTFLKTKPKNPFKSIWKKTISGKPNRNNFGVSALSQAVQIADIPWCGHRFTPTHHFLHPAVPVCVDLQRARGVLQGKRAFTTGTRKLEKAPWASCWVLPQLFHTPLETEGHVQALPPCSPIPCQASTRPP